MSSVQTFCVRWLALIVIASGAVIPVSKVMAEQSTSRAANEQETSAKR